jgi:molybdopterin/thiamine biosynthesis adenylyltransferase
MEWHNSKVLLIGLGGFGSPWLEALMALGPTTIGLCDGDIVSESNLNRQFIHNNRVNQKKVDSAQSYLIENNFLGEIDIFPFFANNETIHSLSTKFDLILDGTDNFSAKYIIHSWAKKNNKKLLMASGTDKYAQTSFFDFSQKSACLECLYPRTSKMGQLEVCGQVTNPVPLKEVALMGLKLVEENKFEILAHYEAKTNEWSWFTKKSRKECSCQNPFLSLFEDYQWRGRGPFHSINFNDFKGALSLKTSGPNVIHCSSGIKARNLCLKLRSEGINNVFWDRSTATSL